MSEAATSGRRPAKGTRAEGAPASTVARSACTSRESEARAARRSTLAGEVLRRIDLREDRRVPGHAVRNDAHVRERVVRDVVAEDEVSADHRAVRLGVVPELEAVLREQRALESRVVDEVDTPALGDDAVVGVRPLSDEREHGGVRIPLRKVAI